MNKPNVAPLLPSGEQGSIVSDVSEKSPYRIVETVDFLATFHTVWYSSDRQPEHEVRVGVIRQLGEAWIAVSLAGAHKEEEFASLGDAQSWLVKRHQENQRSYQAHVKLMAAPSW